MRAQVLHWARARVGSLLGVRKWRISGVRWDSFETGRGKARAHRAQAFYHTTPWPLNRLLLPRLSLSGKVQGGVRLLLQCGFQTTGALSSQCSSAEAFPNRFRPPVFGRSSGTSSGPPPYPARSLQADPSIPASSLTKWSSPRASPRQPLNVKHCDHHTDPAQQTVSLPPP